MSTYAKDKPKQYNDKINNTINVHNQRRKMLFVPDMYFMGAKRNDPIIKEMVEYLKKVNRNPHFSNEMDLTGEVSDWLLQKVNKHEINLIGGEIVGVKTDDRKTILLDNLMEEDYLKINQKNLTLKWEIDCSNKIMSEIECKDTIDIYSVCNKICIQSNLIIATMRENVITLPKFSKFLEWNYIFCIIDPITINNFTI